MTKLSPAAQAALTKLSPAAQALLTEITQQEYCLDPAEIPLEACRMAYIASAALRALVQHEGESVCTYDEGKFSVVREDRILAIAAELEADR